MNTIIYTTCSFEHSNAPPAVITVRKVRQTVQTQHHCFELHGNMLILDDILNIYEQTVQTHRNYIEDA
jgi:hypothetical protein